MFVENAFGRWVKLFITYGIARAAVPLFFMFAAFLQAKKSDSYPILLKKRTKSLLLPYIIWMGLIVFYYGGLKLIILKIRPSLIHNPENTILSWTLTNWIHNTIGYGQTNWPALSAQFWFVRDLMILVLISPVLKWLVQNFPIGFLFFVTAVYAVPVQLYLVVSQALFFYVLGLYWGMYDIPLFETVDKISWKENFVLYLLAFFYTYTIGKGDYTTEHYFMVISSCVIFLKLSALIVRYEKVYAVTSYLAGFSFFLFALHEPVLNGIVSKVWIRFFPMKNTFFCLLQYFVPTFIVIAIGTGVGIALKKICPPLFRLLNGGR